MADALPSSPTMRTTCMAEIRDGNAECTPIMTRYSTSFQDIHDSKAELLARVHSLRKDLRDWRGKLDNQLHSYRQELGELRNTLNVEVEQLKADFQDVRLTLIRTQLDVTARLSDTIIPDKNSSPSPAKPNNPPSKDVLLATIPPSKSPCPRKEALQNT